MGAVALTAPDDWGWIGGSTLYGGVINGFSSGINDNQTHYYIGGTLATPVTGLKVGGSFDYLNAFNHDSSGDIIWTMAGYGSYQATEKLSFHGRAEYMQGEATPEDFEFFALTGTVQYDLWENVISRLEIRYDKCLNSPYGSHVFGGKDAGDLGPAVAAVPADAPQASRGVLGGLGITNPVINNESTRAVLVSLQFIYKF
jgi:hypothetical protein